jgi:hypothetical protein
LLSVNANCVEFVAGALVQGAEVLTSEAKNVLSDVKPETADFTLKLRTGVTVPVK